MKVSRCEALVDKRNYRKEGQCYMTRGIIVHPINSKGLVKRLCVHHRKAIDNGVKLNFVSVKSSSITSPYKDSGIIPVYSQPKRRSDFVPLPSQKEYRRIIHENGSKKRANEVPVHTW